MVSQLSYAQCQYVLCLHWLEGLRAANLDAEVGFFRNLFGYLEDEGIKKGPRCAGGCVCVASSRPSLPQAVRRCPR